MISTRRRTIVEATASCGKVAFQIGRIDNSYSRVLELTRSMLSEDVLEKCKLVRIIDSVLVWHLLS